MRYLRFTILAGGVLAGSLALADLGLTGALAQQRVAPPSPVDSAPLAPPPGAAPAQAPAPVPPAPPAPAEPQPVQPPPSLQGPVVPQPVQPAPTPQVPVEPQPVQPPPSLPTPGGQPAPVAPPQQTGTIDPNATLAGRKGDVSDVDEVQLVSKPVLALAGRSSWDEGFRSLSESFRILREEAASANLPIAGRPLTLFVETDDNGFRFEAMLPVGPGPEGARRSEFGQGVKPGMTPGGPSLRFVHVAPYDDIDSTYETITAYLEAKSIVVKDAFLEEYVGDLKDAGDPNLEINVYVQPR